MVLSAIAQIIKEKKKRKGKQKTKHENSRKKKTKEKILGLFEFRQKTKKIWMTFCNFRLHRVLVFPSNRVRPSIFLSVRP